MEIDSIYKSLGLDFNNEVAQMRREFGMDLVISCRTSDVLEKLKENRTKHEQDYKEACEGYLVKAEELLKKKLKIIKNGKVEDVNVRLTIPQNHLEEYNTVIVMLEMHCNETIDLTSNEVRQFVQNKWSWSDSFAVTTSMYSGLKKG